MSLYFDNNATMPLRNEAFHAMNAIARLPLNASSSHAPGRRAWKLLNEARTQIAAQINADDDQLIFTSGATEANNFAMTAGFCRSGKAQATHMVRSELDHPSVLAGSRFAAENVVIVDVTSDGVICKQSLTSHLEALRRQQITAVVSVPLVQGETGVIQPVAEFAEIVQALEHYIIVDASQALGKIAVDITQLGVDAMIICAHKIGGPVGIGALALRDANYTMPHLIAGGGQEDYRRGGTEHVVGAVGFAAAAEVAHGELDRFNMLSQHRDRIETSLATAGDELVFYGQNVERVANTTLIGVPANLAYQVFISLDLQTICVSLGAACSSGSTQTSRALKSMQASGQPSRDALRISLSLDNDKNDIDRLIDAARTALGQQSLGQLPVGQQSLGQLPVGELSSGQSAVSKSKPDQNEIYAAAADAIAVKDRDSHTKI